MIAVVERRSASRRGGRSESRFSVVLSYLRDTQLSISSGIDRARIEGQISMGGRRFGRPFPSRVVLGQRSHRRNVPLGFLAHIFLHTLNNLPLTSCAPNLFAIRTAIYSRTTIAHRVLHGAFPTRTRPSTPFLTLFSHLHRSSVSARLHTISFDSSRALSISARDNSTSRSVASRAAPHRASLRISTPWKVGKKRRNTFRPAGKSRVSSSLFGCFLSIFSQVRRNACEKERGGVGVRAVRFLRILFLLLPPSPFPPRLAVSSPRSLLSLFLFLFLSLSFFLSPVVSLVLTRARV